MAIKVRELAKELKISSGALKQYLASMGVVVRSHMSSVEEADEKKIRAMFQQEIEKVKKRKQDTKEYHKRIDDAKKIQEKKAQIVQKVEKKPEIKIKTVPKFVEKNIKQSPKRTVKKTQPGSVIEKKKPLTKTEVAPKTETIPENLSKRDKKRKEKEQRNKSKEDKYSRKRKQITEQEHAQISKDISKTLQATAKKKKYKKDDKQQDVNDTKIVVNEFTSVSELAKLMGLGATEIIVKFFNLGQMVTINQRLDKDSLELICGEFEFDVEFSDEYGSDILDENITAEHENLPTETRPPIVTVMGHVDHGKTAILDRIRQTNVIAGESGGITQHIGAYQVIHDDKKITFLDTPGHEAFAAMRARGANITDIAIIVVAANESVKQQTIEAIDHAKAAGVTIIVAINKVDLKNANIDKTINDLMTHNVMLESYGGEISWVPCSAKTGEGIDELLETILLTAEILELKTPVGVEGKGIVIESKKDSRMGTTVTILLQEGTLEKSDNIVCGATYGRIRKMEDERGKEIKHKLTASDVAVIYGLNKVPKAGDILNKVADDKIARQIGMERLHVRKERERYQSKTNLGNLFQKIKEENMSEVKLIVKADTDGSVEALCDSFQKMSTDEIIVNIIHKAVGGINEADVNLASASDAVIIGFHVRTQSSASKLAENEKVQIKNYQIIYEAIEDIKNAMEGMLAPEIIEKTLGNAIVRQVFKIKGVGTIAGCAVEKGKVTNEGKVRIFRNDILIHEGDLDTLKHYQKDVKQVKAGSECGIAVKDYNDLKVNDIIENYIIEEKERKL